MNHGLPTPDGTIPDAVNDLYDISNYSTEPNNILCYMQEYLSEFLQARAEKSTGKVVYTKEVDRDIHRPDRYTGPSGMDIIDESYAEGTEIGDAFCRYNILKYLRRYKAKEPIK